MDNYYFQQELGKLIRFLREQKGLSQNALAQELNLDQSCVSRWEKGTLQVGMETVPRLSSIFLIPIQDFYTPEQTLVRLEKAADRDDAPATESSNDTSAANADTPASKAINLHINFFWNKEKGIIIALSLIIVLLSGIIIVQNTMYFPPSYPPMEDRYVYDEQLHEEILECSFVYHGILTPKRFSDIAKDLTIAWRNTPMEKEGVTTQKISFYNNTKKAEQWDEPQKALYIPDPNKQ